MRIACFIPIKSNSERIVGKNFKKLCGRPLYTYIIDHAIAADCFDDIYVDTNSTEVIEYCNTKGVKIIEREEKYTKNTVNGNDLLNHHYDLYPNYDYYFQLFATAPFLQPESIRNAVNALTCSINHDSTFTAIKHNGFFWFSKTPINYRPCILPRSQDMEGVIEETTGLYGMSNSALNKYKCRIGANPLIYFVNKFEAVDINTEDDFKLAEYIGRNYWNFK